MEFPLTSLKSEQQLHDAQAVLDELLAKGKLSVGKERIWTLSAIWSPPTRISTYHNRTGVGCRHAAALDGG